MNMHREKVITLDSQQGIDFELVLIDGEVNEYRVIFESKEQPSLWFAGEEGFREANATYFRAVVREQLAERIGIDK